MWWWRACLIKGTKWASLQMFRTQGETYSEQHEHFWYHKSKNPTQRAVNRLMHLRRRAGLRGWAGLWWRALLGRRRAVWWWRARLIKGSKWASV